MVKFKLKLPRFSREAALSVGAALLGIILIPRINVSGGTPPVPPIGGGSWSPRWALGDLLKSRDLPDATWLVKLIDYAGKRYGCGFTWAGPTQDIWVDAANLEVPGIYKAN